MESLNLRALENITTSSWPKPPGNLMAEQYAKESPVAAAIAKMGNATSYTDSIYSQISQLSNDNDWQFENFNIPPIPKSKGFRTFSYFDGQPSWCVTNGVIDYMHFKTYISSDASAHASGMQSTIEIALLKRYPHLYLDSQANEGTFNSSLRRIIDISQRIDLEANYAQHFVLYAPNGFQIDALSLIEPSIMQTLLTLKHRFDVEVYDQKLLLRTNDLIYTKDVFQEALIAAQAVYKHFARTDTFWHPSDGQTEPPKLLISKSSGDIFKIGRARIFTILPMMVVFAIGAFLFVKSTQGPNNLSTLRDDIDTLIIFGTIFIIFLAFSIGTRYRKK